MAQNGLEFRLQKKFDAIEFRDLGKLTAQVFRNKALLKEERERNSSSLKTYYKDPNYKIDTAEIIGKEPFNVKAL